MFRAILPSPAFSNLGHAARTHARHALYVDHYRVTTLVDILTRRLNFYVYNKLGRSRLDLVRI